MRSSLTQLIGLMVVGCASHGGQTGDAAGNEAVVTGSVSYRERIALPPDAVVKVQLSDVSRQDAPAPLIAETTVQPEGLAGATAVRAPL
jgi:putative lipoprotein